MKECPSCNRCFPDQSERCLIDDDLLVTTFPVPPVLDSRYQLRRRLGQGGMGAVYKAQHIFLKTTHAIKVILPDLVGNDPELARRFRQEAMAAAAIRHHNVIAVTDYGLVNETMPFIVMEFIQGKSLQDVLNEIKRFTSLQALEFMSAVGAGMGAAHRRGIVHRDLKPLNIMIEDALPISEAVKVLDFGLAKIRSGELLGSFVAAKTTGIMGSPYYMAPEQWSDEEPDQRADIYSLGIILYQMLAGDVPFKGPSVPAIMKKHLMDAPPRFAEHGVPVSPGVENVVRRALEKDPDRRPQTAGEFINELREAVTTDYATRRPTQTAGDLQPETLISPTSRDQLAGTISDQQSAGVRSTDAFRGISDAQILFEAQRREAEVRRRQEEEAARWRANKEQERLEAEARMRAAEEALKREAEEAAQRAAEEEQRKQEAARRAEEEQLRLEVEAAARRVEAERQQRELAAEQQRQVEAEARRRAEEEAARRQVEAAAAARQRAEAARRQQEEAARRHAEAEAARLAEEARQRKAREEAARLAAEEAARLAEEQRLAEEAARLAEEQRLAEEAARRAEEERRRLEAEEAARRAAEEDRRRLAIEAARRAEAERLLRQEAEARQRAEAEVAARAEEEQRQAEAARLAEEERQRNEEAQRRQREAEEVAVRLAEEERLAEERARQSEAERQQLAAAEQQRQDEAAARKQAEEEARREQEAKQQQRELKKAARKAEAEQRKREAAEVARQAQEERRRLEAEEAERRAVEEAQRKAEEEARQRKAEEEERQRLQAEARRQQAAAAARKQAEQSARQRAEEEQLRLEVEAAARRVEAERQQRELAAEQQRQVEAEARRRAEEEAARRQVEAAAAARQRAEAARRQQEEAARRRAEAEQQQRAEKERAAQLEREAATRAAAEVPALVELAAQSATVDVPEADAPVQPERPAHEQPVGAISYPPPVTRLAQESSQHMDGMRAQQADALNQAAGLPQSQTPFQDSAVIAPPPRSPLPLVIGLVAALLLVGSLGMGVYFWSHSTTSNPPDINGGGKTDGQKPVAAREMVLISGGTFQMGRSDVDPTSDEHGNEYPAHAVTVKPFYMDKTEVTNAEYAQFVDVTGRRVPRDETLGDKEAPYWKPWVNGKPPAGQEQWPVRNVSPADAEDFAGWLSKRDGVKYRLPREEEWEYAARSGGANKLYPWGDEWQDNRANVDATLPQAVDSFPRGASKEGILNLIGNVWEWTSSEATFYTGGSRQVPEKERNQVIRRGGSFVNKAHGDEGITATSRDWLPATTKAPTIGFRLVRDGS